jgi:hypothetical protein
LTGAGGTLTVQGTMELSHALLQGNGQVVIAAGATLNIDAAAGGSTIDGMTVVNAGTTNWNSGDIYFPSGVFKNTGTFNINITANQGILPNPAGNCNGLFINLGSGNTGFINQNVAFVTTVDCQLQQDGTLSLGRGTFAISSNWTQPADGTLSIGLGGVLQVTGTFTNQGKIAVQSGGGRINANLLVNAGSLDFRALLLPGVSPPALQVTGNYQQTSTGTLYMVIGGTGGNPMQWSVLNIQGTSVSLGGDLTVSYINGYDPQAAHSPPFSAWPIVSCPNNQAVPGNFNTWNLPAGFLPPAPVMTGVTVIWAG